MRKNMNLDKIAILFSIVIFIVYLSTLSISLDDEDSAHFALGLKEFNVTKYQPHAPGFPVYMAIGVFFNTIFRNEIFSLTFMSAMFGAFSVFVFYLLTKEMFSKEIALVSIVLNSSANVVATFPFTLPFSIITPSKGRNLLIVGNSSDVISTSREPEPASRSISPLREH